MKTKDEEYKSTICHNHIGDDEGWALGPSSSLPVGRMSHRHACFRSMTSQSSFNLIFDHSELMISRNDPEAAHQNMESQRSDLVETEQARATPEEHEKTPLSNSVEEDDGDGENSCSICLHGMEDRTVIPNCSHEFCFECLVVWTGTIPERLPSCSVS